jgi:hypothetical protein
VPRRICGWMLRRAVNLLAQSQFQFQLLSHIRVSESRDRVCRGRYVQHKHYPKAYTPHIRAAFRPSYTSTRDPCSSHRSRRPRRGNARQTCRRASICAWRRAAFSRLQRARWRTWGGSCGRGTTRGSGRSIVGCGGFCRGRLRGELISIHDRGYWRVRRWGIGRTTGIARNE